MQHVNHNEMQFGNNIIIKGTANVTSEASPCMIIIVFLITLEYHLLSGLFHVRVSSACRGREAISLKLYSKFRGGPGTGSAQLLS